MNKLNVGIFICLFGNQVYANDLQKQLDSCLQVNDSLQRLHCFETVTRRNSKKNINAPVSTSSKPAVKSTISYPETTTNNHNYQTLTVLLHPGEDQIGPWKIHVANSALRQDYKVTAINTSISGRNQYASPILMKLKCDNGSSSLKVIWGEDMVTDQQPVVLIDSNSSKLGNHWQWTDKSRNWQLSESSADFLRRISTSETMTAVAEMFDQENLANYDSGEIHAQFSVIGTQKLLKVLAPACGF